MASEPVNAFQVRPRGSWFGDPVDRVLLAYDDRYRRRLLVTCESGTQVLLNFAEARVLRDGDALVVGDGDLIEVKAASERLIEIVCADVRELVRVAWHLGNRHLATQLLGDRLRIREDHVIADMVCKLGAKATPIEAPFDPEGGAYGHGAVQSHSHGPSHDHSHDH